MLLNLAAIVVIAFHFYSAAHAMSELTDWLAGITYTGHFASTVRDALRLVYQRGLFDGFVAGALTVLILKRDRSK